MELTDVSLPCQVWTIKQRTYEAIPYHDIRARGKTLPHHNFICYQGLVQG